ncbi:alpha/beta hydrolase [Kluyvera sp. STS39-E]|uniref:alpha/beta hydrolase n=1 Tax=Kluyvera sp. STS39-E TaxID=3234748 RepID=UPI0034C62AE9
MDRRQFLLCFPTVALALKSGAIFAASAVKSPYTLRLWPGLPPGGGGPTGEMHISPKGAQSHIALPFLTVVTPVSPNGHGVLIAAGGGYKRIEMAMEAWPAAHWLVARGYTAYILSYRLPGEGWHDGNEVALQDAQRALRMVRSREKQVSVLGFSAGGHLLAMAATRPDYRSYTRIDALDNLPPRADSAALIYPIITLEKPFNHTSTHKILLGHAATPAQEAAWSVQHYVTPQTPPVFLVQAEDDPVSDPRNTLIMQAACIREQVDVTLYRYPTGGHGFAMGRLGTPTVQWPAHYEKWLSRLNRGQIVQA